MVNSRTDYGRTLQFSGQIQAGRGYVITRVEFINKAQFGSVNGPNIKKIQSGAAVEISDILSETSRQLEEAYNKAKAEYKNVKYMAEANDRILREIASRKEALSKVNSNVDVVNWDGSVSGRCVRSILGRCVDSTGGKLEGFVRVYKLYIGTNSDTRTFQQSAQASIAQALTLTQQENKPVTSSGSGGGTSSASGTVEQPACEKLFSSGRILDAPHTDQEGRTWGGGITISSTLNGRFSDGLNSDNITINLDSNNRDNFSFVRLGGQTWQGQCTQSSASGTWSNNFNNGRGTFTLTPK